MASSNLLSLALFLVLLTHAISAIETSFNFTSFHQGDPKLILQADANVSSKGQLLLTNVTGNGDPTVDSMGRAFYYAPIQIRNSTTGKLASFDTNFTFSIRSRSNNNKNSAFGLAFALVPVESQPKRKGPFLGLFKKPDNDSEVQTVAVVFNTFSNQIEIDMNSISPAARESCDFHKYNGEKAEVRITYDSSQMIMGVFLSYPSTGKSYTLRYDRIDLQFHVHDWMSVGFSATSGFFESTSETHDVLSWSFSSKFSQHTTSERSNILLNKIL
uniref:Arcelin n=1 Tax=Phaseolus vulgaris TaxID=3885 RepID=Q8RVY3_PHAVU|nr:arcelin [Phaseolus vulgaris]CAD58679.1 arcelin 4-II precursor [Phaseolus vulgaris]